MNSSYSLVPTADKNVQNKRYISWYVRSYLIIKYVLYLVYKIKSLNLVLSEQFYIESKSFTLIKIILQFNFR